MQTGPISTGCSGSKARICKILGIGTPIIDHTLMVSNDILRSLSGSPGGSEPIDSAALRRLLEGSPSPPVSSIGGSAVNTLKGLSSLGNACTLFGKIGNDPAGEMVRASMTALGVATTLIPVDKPTAQVACLLSPDRDRTMRYCLGAGADLRPEDLTPELFRGMHLVHIEGYLLERTGVVRRAMELAKEAGAQISMDLSSFEIVSKHKAAIIELVSLYTDIVFANTQETLALTGLDPKRGCTLLKDISDIAVVKMGEQGGWVANAKGEPRFYPAIPTIAVDTTGAGDFFASGFLHGHMLKKDIDICAHYGAVVAAHIIQVVGADLPATEWEAIKMEVC